MKNIFLTALVFLSATAALAQQSPAADPKQMSLDALQAEVNAARPFIDNGGVSTQGNAPGCDTTESHQLDFWIGDWDVVLTSNLNVVIADVEIRSILQGCALTQDFRPFNGGHGFGLFGYSAPEHMWHQSYLDSSGVYGTAQGRLENGVMSFLITAPAPPSRFPADMQRHINFQRIDNNSVRQWGERLDPTEQRWVTFFDFTYHRRPRSR